MGGPGSGRRKGGGKGIWGKESNLKRMSKGQRKLRKNLLGESRPPKKIRKAMKSLAKHGSWYAATN